jgi:hypothetical protein
MSGLVNLDSLPGVTLDGTKVFAPKVRVRYTTKCST